MSDAEKTAPAPADAAAPESPPLPAHAPGQQEPRTLTVRVHRCGPGGTNARFDDFRLPVRPED